MANIVVITIMIVAAGFLIGCTVLDSPTGSFPLVDSRDLVDSSQIQRACVKFCKEKCGELDCMYDCLDERCNAE